MVLNFFWGLVTFSVCRIEGLMLIIQSGCSSIRQIDQKMGEVPFYVLFKIFLSLKDDVRVIYKGCVQ